MRPSPKRGGGASESLIEAAWLAAAVVVPLIFNQQAFESFHPYKAAMERLLAAVIVAAWGMRACRERRLVEIDRLPPRLIGIALLCFLGVQLLATVFSINPRSSFWVEGNSQGLITALSEAVLFLAVSAFACRFRQIDRLIAALIAGSIPVALYGLVQRMGLDPIAFADASLEKDRVFSTLGHGIFLGAYLTMVMPLTWWRIAQEAAFRQARTASRSSVFGLLFYPVVAVLQLGAFICAQSRGPLLGLLATATFFALGWAICTGRSFKLRPVAAAIGATVAFLVFINLPLTASSRVAAALHLERFADTFSLKKGPDPFRQAHWQAGVDLMTSPKAIVFPTGGSDRWHSLRPWIGYGPETLVDVLPQRFLWPSTELHPESRLHDRVLDLWFTSGLAGVIAFFAFFLIVFRHGMKFAGWEAKLAIYLGAPGMAVLTAGLFSLVGGRAFLGLGAIVGLVAACTICLLIGARPANGASRNSDDGSDRRLLVIGLLAAMVGHVLETGFAFTVPATSLLFWLYAGLLIAIPRADQSDEEPATVLAARGEHKARPVKRQLPSGLSWGAAWRAAYVPALILATLVFAFVRVYSVDSIDWKIVLCRTLLQIKGEHGPSYLIWLLSVPTWLATSFLFVTEEKASGSVRWWVPLTISGAVGIGFAIVQAARIAEIGPLPTPSDEPATALGRIGGYQALFFGYIGLVLVLMLGAAWIFVRPVASEGARSEPAWRGVAVNILAMGLGLCGAWFLALREIHAEITGTWGRALVTFGRLEAGTEVLQRALQEMPYSILDRRELAQAFIRRAQASHSYESFDWLCTQAEASLIWTAEQNHGLNTASADLTRLYLPWAAFAPDAGQRLALGRKAAKYFQWQQTFAPGHPLSWLDAAVFDELLQQPEEAARKLETADRLMDRLTGAWATAYRQQALGCSSPDLRRAFGAVDLHLYDATLRGTHEAADAALARLGRAELNLGLGHIEEARQECLEIQSFLPSTEQWKAESTLAGIAWQTRDFVAARSHIERSIALAPEEQKAALLGQQRQIFANEATPEKAVQPQ